MTIATIQAQDATHVNQASIPPGVLACGYDTGTSDIRWTAADYAAHAKPYPAIHIDQDPSASDATADVLDVESGAATVAEIPGWLTRARANYHTAARPSQRWPAVYLSMSNLTPAVNACRNAGLVNVPFWTAEPGNTLAYAQTRVATATGPYPCIGVQYKWGNVVDYDVFSLPWVTTTAEVHMSQTISQKGWKWCHRCQGLFYGPNAAVSVCPAGGHHDGSRSGDYQITDVTG